MARKRGVAEPAPDLATPRTGTAPPLPSLAHAERQVMVAFPVPETLHTAIKVRAAQERTTVRGMVMKALKSLGLDVPDTELADRRLGRAGRQAKER